MRMLLLIIEVVTFLLATCSAVPQCQNGTIAVENASAMIESINQARRNLADGLQTTVNNTLLPTPKSMYDLQWDCEVEKRLVRLMSAGCVGDHYDDYFFWLQHDAAEGQGLLEYLSEQLARIKDEAPKNITEDAIVYNDIVDPRYGSYKDDYYLFVYLNLMNARAQKFACINTFSACPIAGFEETYYCATEQEWFKPGDIVYEIAKSTTSTITTSATVYEITKTVNSTVRTSATVQQGTTSATLQQTTTSATLQHTASTIAKRTTTQCAKASTVPTCATMPPKKSKREVKSAAVESNLMERSNVLKENLSKGSTTSEAPSP